MKSNFILSCILAMLAASPNVRGQSIGPSVLNANGGSGTAGGNTFEWSIGETMVSTYTSSSIVVTQGVLQPTSGTTEIADNTLAPRLDVFPNPSSALVNLQFNAPAQGTLTYRLSDLLGRVIQEKAIEVNSGTTSKQLNIKDLACATYMLQVMYKTKGNNEESATYKIQKLN
jgi:hypothetical protein